jgi:hypothetical protein
VAIRERKSNRESEGKHEREGVSDSSARQQLPTGQHSGSFRRNNRVVTSEWLDKDRNLRRKILMGILQERSLVSGSEGSPPETKPAPKLDWLLLQRDRILRDLVKCGHRFGVGFITTLRHNQVGKFCSNIHIRQL